MVRDDVVMSDFIASRTNHRIIARGMHTVIELRAVKQTTPVGCRRVRHFTLLDIR
jgi:hypothetical protein